MPIPVGYKETIVTPQMSRTVEARWTFMPDRSGSALVLPDGRCDIILRYSIHDTKRPLPIVTGPATQAYWVPYIEGECWIGMRMRPECGAWIWKDKIDQAADAVLRGERTYSLLPAICMYACRQALLDNFFGMVKNIQEGQPNRRLCEAVKLLHVSGGRIRLENLADMTQCTTRHLNRLFRANVGLTAKTYAQLVRFHRAVRLVQTGHLSLTDAALECGYADHAHMTRTLRKFGGFTPSNIPSDLSQPSTLTQHVRFIQDTRERSR